jgi:hypothetical protein
MVILKSRLKDQDSKATEIEGLIKETPAKFDSQQKALDRLTSVVGTQYNTLKNHLDEREANMCTQEEFKTAMSKQYANTAQVSQKIEDLAKTTCTEDDLKGALAAIFNEDLASHQESMDARLGCIETEMKEIIAQKKTMLEEDAETKYTKAMQNSDMKHLEALAEIKTSVKKGIENEVWNELQPLVETVVRAKLNTLPANKVQTDEGEFYVPDTMHGLRHYVGQLAHDVDLQRAQQQTMETSQ